MANFLELQDKIGYEFKQEKLLRQALTHSSFANEKHLRKHSDNERLEFLGDAVLEIVSSDFLYKAYPDKSEGDLTKLRASLVCEPTLAICTREMELGKYLFLGKGENLTGGRNRNSILSDALEAVIGAIYLDGGLNPAREFILQYVLSDIEKKQLFYDSKTILQEIIQSKFHEKTNLSYALEKEEGPDHNKLFEVVCMVNEKAYGRGKGRTKKAAEQKAAYETILLLRQEK